MSQMVASEPLSAEQQDLAFRTLRATLLFGASHWVFIGAVAVLTTRLPLVAVIAIAIAGASWELALVRYFERRRRAQAAESADPLTGEVNAPGPRLPLPRQFSVRLALIYAGEIAVVVFLVATHSRAADSCARSGISTPTAHEGTCVRYASLFGGRTVYNVVDAGHVLHMPGYDVQLRATNVTPTHVLNPETDPAAYPGGQGLLVSFQISVTNESDGPLAFDAAGRDVTLLIDDLDRSSHAISFPDLPHASGEPGAAIVDIGPIAPHDVVTGWVSFVAPVWARTALNERGADLEFRRPGDESGYTGQIRLWKWANARGRAALSSA